MEDAVAALQRAISALEAQRGLIGAAAVDAALHPLRERLSQLQRPGEQQLRQVSVLFVDIAGSTALARQLDPEDVHEVMDGALRRFTARVQEQGGRVLQYAGDSLLAAFGTPAAREDDAERAVRAGLAVLAEARELAEDWQARLKGDGFAVRAGIATGPVLLGGGIDGDASIRGAVVNLAARMEQTAPQGGLRICPDTRRLVRGLFELDAQPPLLVKGYVEPIATWLVQRAAAFALPQATRGVGGVHTPLVGRQVELAALQAAYHARREPGANAPGVVVVLGDAGLGKSRLAAEFRAWTRTQPEGAYWLEAHASERGAGQPYGLLRQLLARHQGLLDSDSAADARRTWLQATAPLLAQEGDAAVLGHLLGLDFAGHDEVRPLLAEGRQLRDRAFFHATQALGRIAVGAGPLALFLDDLQWADPGTLEFIEYAQREGAPLLMLLCSSRPALDLQRPGWTAQAGRQRIDLPPLSGSDASALADALLARLPQAPQALRQRLIDGAEGNPFYMEELVNMLIDRGVIVEHEDGWRMGPQPLDATAMPRTLAGVLQARLDELEPEQARAVQLAAVVGYAFWADALRALGLDDDAAALQTLVRRQFIVPRPASSLAGQQEYAFRHHLLHQVCYERVLRRVKVPAHAQVAQWLAAQPGERPLDLIAEHHERGGQPQQALDAWHKAAEAARARYANAQALAGVQRALALLPPDDSRRQFTLKLVRAQVLGMASQLEPLQQELDALSALAELLDDDLARAEVAYRRSVLLESRGDSATGVLEAERALAWAGTASPRLAAAAGRALCSSLLRLGRIAEARERGETALEIARRHGENAAHGALLNELAGIAAEQGDITLARERYEQALALHRELGQRSHEAGTLSNLGYVDLGLGDYEGARPRLQQARELFARIGQRGREGIVGINQAMVSLHTGQPQAALDEARAALETLRRAGSRAAEAAALRVQGQAALDLGALEQAAQCLAESQAAFEALGLPQMALEARASRAQVALAQDDCVGALAHADAVLAALDAGTGLEGTEEPMRVHLACWQALRAADDARAPLRLNLAVSELRARAERLAAAHERESYLRRVPHHRALLLAAGLAVTEAPLRSA